ncbi:hypothetical protein LCGC14_0547990 [marine sediment metagenome]|uniref:Uncharacterized protein n=1 Tax=marine sediment metagenome TaxID=412755 RepID=A0A0F9S9G1_9ZZZZ
MRKTICLIEGPLGNGCKNPPHDYKIIIIEDIIFKFYYCDFHSYEAKKLEHNTWSKAMEQEIQ